MCAAGRCRGSSRLTRPTAAAATGGIFLYSVKDRAAPKILPGPFVCAGYTFRLQDAKTCRPEKTAIACRRSRQAIFSFALQAFSVSIPAESIKPPHLFPVLNGIIGGAVRFYSCFAYSAFSFRISSRRSTAVVPISADSSSTSASTTAIGAVMEWYSSSSPRYTNKLISARQLSL